jgi:hypothetical protein
MDEESIRALSALAVVRQLREVLDAWEPELIEAARALGVSWASLAPALGVASRQAAERRYLRLRPSTELTREGAVRAERDRRAGDRAVAQWARDHSATLRQLAGQVSALDGLPSAARERADVVQQALADNDAASLLSPLADSQADLTTSHANLAAQIQSVTDHTDRVRQDVASKRQARG